MEPPVCVGEATVYAVSVGFGSLLCSRMEIPSTYSPTCGRPLPAGEVSLLPNPYSWSYCMAHGGEHLSLSFQTTPSTPLGSTPLSPPTTRGTNIHGWYQWGSQIPHWRKEEVEIRKKSMSPVRRKTEEWNGHVFQKGKNTHRSLQAYKALWVLLESLNKIL